MFIEEVIVPEKNPPITTLLGLLEVLFIDQLFGDHRKTGARMKCFLPSPPEVVEYFDDGHGHSGAFSQGTIPLDQGVFDEALREGYIAGVLEPGYVSRTEFKLTDQGKRELLRLTREAMAAERAAAEVRPEAA